TGNSEALRRISAHSYRSDVPGFGEKCTRVGFRGYSLADSGKPVPEGMEVSSVADGLRVRRRDARESRRHYAEDGTHPLEGRRDQDSDLEGHSHQPVIGYEHN